MASIDGYCSLVVFDDGELGEVLPKSGGSEPAVSFGAGFRVRFLLAWRPHPPAPN